MQTASKELASIIFSCCHNLSNMKFSRRSIIIAALLLACTTTSVAASDSWSGRLDLGLFIGISGCGYGTKNATSSGYASAVKAIGDGNICETDHFYDENGNLTTFYTKWVTKCGPQGILPSAMYQFVIACNDSDCNNCTSQIDGAAQIPWSYFSPEPQRCMSMNDLKANTTDPVKEFANSSTDNISAFIGAPSSQSFTGSEEDFNGYWNVFLEHSCMGPEPTNTTDGVVPSSSSSAPNAVAGGIGVSAVFVGMVASLFVF